MVTRIYSHLGFKESILIVLISFLACSCVYAGDDSSSSVSVPESAQITPVQRDEIQKENPVDAIQIAAEPTQISFPVITAKNSNYFELNHELSPFFPEMMHISSDEHTVAVGGFSGIKVFDVDSGKKKMSIDIQIPVCQFGMSRYFQLNYDGTYLAIAARKGVQVWQVGGGIVYESSYNDEYVLDNKTCGKDVPQLALSPDGTLLAQSGIRFSEHQFESYFRVIDILQNEIVFEWDGRGDSPHGNLYDFPSLGFSSDGTVLQTFDPSRFMMDSKEFHSAFRFWNIKDWEELDRDSGTVRLAFSAGEMQFTRSEHNQVVIYKKTNGERINSISVAGCDWEFPCPVKFSNDGETAAILRWGNALNYKREWIHTKLDVIDISSGREINSHSVKMRNVDGFLLDDTGVIYIEISANDEISSWWTQADYFFGFRIIDEQTIAFTPQIHSYIDANLNYSGSCAIDLENYSIHCTPALLFNGDKVINLENKIDGFSLYEVNGKDQVLISDIRNPSSETDDFWQFRLLDYIGEMGLGFFCLDRNLREETCAIMDFSSNEILHEQIDLKGFVYSRKNEMGAFIDRNEKALFLFNPVTRTVKRMRTYQAIALPIRPAILPAEGEMIYIVQSIDNPKNLYLERINSDVGKVIKRVDVEEIRDRNILCLAANPESGLLAAADADGFVYLIDYEKEEVINTLNVSNEEIIDLIFSSDGKKLIIMERTGVIQVWAVK